MKKMIERTPKGFAAVHLGLLLVGTAAMTACGESDFKGTTPKKPGFEAEAASERLLNITCAGSGGVANLVTDLSGTARDLVKLEGEFCQLPESEGKSGELDIVFTIDFSASMKINDLGTGTSCGRLEAVSAIYNKLKTTIPAGASVRVGVIGFDSASMTKVPLTKFEAFSSSLLYSNFCGENARGYTNYAAAFDATRTLLSESKGNKTVYLISDGMPTVGGGLFGTPHAAGLAAAEKMKTDVKDLVLNAVFLGADATTVSSTAENPKVYLEKITGTPDRVRVVASADAMATEIVTFEDPVIPTMNAASATGSITAPGYSARDLKIMKLEQDSSRKGVWLFETEPFKLNTAADKAVSNQVTLRVKSSDGTERVATAMINFTVK